MVDFCAKCGSILIPTKKDGKKVLCCKMCDNVVEPDAASTSDFKETTKIDHKYDKTLIKNEAYLKSIYGDKHSVRDCPRCGGKVQRIRYASNETNYCPACQTGGKLLADRSLSRLLKADWPKTIDEAEAG